MGRQEDLWYAVNITKVVHSPEQTLETFGTTTVRYHFLSELMDEVNRVRLREGSVYSERPQIITPSNFASRLLDGFGEKAQEYAEWLLSHGEMVRILKYGLHFRKDKISEKFISGSIEDIADTIKEKVMAKNEDFSAVVIGADELWEVSLLKFVVDYLQKSAVSNFDELSRQGKTISIGASSNSISKQALRERIVAEFEAASFDRSRIESLGKLLQKYGLFEEYEDQFYNLIKNLG